LYDIAAWRSQFPPKVADGRMRNFQSIAWGVFPSQLYQCLYQHSRAIGRTGTN